MMNSSNLMSVGIYIRVSTQEQANEGYSIDAQTDRLTNYCRSRDWPIYNVYTDGGYSGSNMNRPALTQLLEDIDAKKVNCVLVYKLDRLSRSQKDTLHIIEDIFTANNVSFVSLSENFDTTSSFGRAIIGVLSVFAQLEREQIKERSLLGRIERAKNGLWHGGGYEPFGYHYVDGQLVFDEKRAPIVRQAFEWFNNRIAITRILTMIEEKFGLCLRNSTIRSILTTRLYTGKLVFRGECYEGQHPAIISEEVFEKAQEIFSVRKIVYKNRPFVKKTMLGGLLYCGNCGARYVAKGNYSGHGDKKVYRPYYTCYSRSKTKPHLIIDPNCKNPSYATVDLNAKVIDAIADLFSSNEALVYAYNHPNPIFSHVPDTYTPQIEVLTAHIAEVDQQINKLLDLYQSDLITMDVIHDRIRELQDKKQTHLKEIQELKEKSIPKTEQSKHLTFDEVLALQSRFGEVLEDDDETSLKELIHDLIHRIILMPEKDEIEIIWNF